MKVYHSTDEIPLIKNPVLTLGTFDGVHSGHLEVINELKNAAKEINGETVLFTFHPHPRMVLHPDDHNLELIQPIEERIDKLEKAGIEHLVLFPFTKEFSRLSAVEFVRNILVNQIHIKILAIGYNHHFGRNREGNIDLLKELGPTYNFQVREIEAMRKGELSVSSTKIRKAIKNGDLPLANQFLGRNFSLKGIVVKGDKLGSKIGFPTANIQITDPYQIIPKEGAYAVKVELKGTIYDGMMNIGIRPTVANTGEMRIEAHLIDFNQDIYDEELKIFFIERIRDEKQFTSLDKLKAQLATDEQTCRHILSDAALVNP